MHAWSRLLCALTTRAERFATANEDFSDRTIASRSIMSVMSPLLTIFVNIGMVIVIWAGGMQAIQGNLSEGQIVAFTNYLLTTMGPLTMMTMLSNVWASGIASMQRIDEVLETVPEVEDEAGADARCPTPVQGRVVFENVAFHYNGSNDASVLDGINLIAEPGEMVAILGATGAGKSSLVNLIPRFYDVAHGQRLD